MKTEGDAGWKTTGEIRAALDRKGMLNGQTASPTQAPLAANRGPPDTPEVLPKVDAPTPLTAARTRRSTAAGFYTQVPNVAFDLPARLGFDAPVFSVLMQLCRLTYGMQSPNLSTTIGLRKLAARANVSRTTLYTALATLEEHQLITRSSELNARGGHTPTEIRLTLPKS